MGVGYLSDDAGVIRSTQEDPMQYSADFVALNLHAAAASRAERKFEIQRSIAERRALEADALPEQGVEQGSRRADRAPRLALR